MPDLYDDLGVPRDASQEDIKAAYRKKASAAHPDNKATGDENEFKRVNHANIILSDPAKREQYDRTGKEDTASPEERENAMALDLLSKMFSQIFTMAEFDPAEHDPLKAVRKLVKIQKGETKKQLFTVAQTLEKMRKTIKRLHKKGKEAKASKLQRVLEALEQSVKAEQEKGERMVRVCDKVLAILAEHDYDLKPEAKTPAEEIIAGFLNSEAGARMKEHLDAHFPGARATGG